ncbi:MAG TPA: alpha/beta hydrolase [Chitinophagales bacterium]|nr:alpha/beta hydrolase [Chitinophagales bacterium]MCB9075233.1 alpha/beta hydrolase [Chitinophagales bacterium]HMU98000.1 alpha/beta hydrolase [Chitinophagales bacterium]HMV02643.1 alpha/beta hydrolase [Chitinophagales bacterium]HMW94421.1 alpha/beta hydrolase [Chitinophagales bacterium]
MRSVQSLVAQGIIRAFREVLFIHKTETNTHRINFERVSNIIKFPRFVKMEETTYLGLDIAWFIPKKLDKKRIVLYLHGGGYCVGSYHSHRALIARIARETQYKTIAINYRMAPENPFPAAVEDAVAIYKQLLADGYQEIIVSGDSAGGGLSLVLTYQIKKLGLQLPKGLILLSPWTDLTMSGESIQTKVQDDALIAPNLIELFANKYIGEDSATNPLISPLFLEFENFPPTLIQVGSFEVLLDDSTRLAKKMHDAGVQVDFEIYEKQMHVFQFLAGIVPEANRAIEKMGKFTKIL